MLKTVLSASRRTDIPAFYLDWFMAGIEQGFFRVANPFNGRVREVPAGPKQVHTIVFWSKNFGRFLQGNYGEDLQAAGYHLFFNFTVNSADSILEPRLPVLDDRLEQLSHLARRFGPERVQWRFDPICCYTLDDGRRRHNLGDFSRIARVAAACGLTVCVTSFVDLYRKVTRRAGQIARQLPGFALVDPDMGQKAKIIENMSSRLAGTGIGLYLCCEKEVQAALSPQGGVRPAACVPGHDFARRDGGGLSLARDPGQRASAGCGCTVSTDIGSYRDQPCFHNCLFCYANPSGDLPGFSE